MATARQTSRIRDQAVTVHGLRDLQTGLSQAGPQYRRLLGITNKTVSETLVAAPARALAQRLGRGQIRLARAGVITAGGTARAATVKLNQTAAVPDAMAQEFGAMAGSIFGRRTANVHGQLPRWRGNANEDTWAEGTGGAGYAMFPAIRANQQRILDEYGDRLTEAFTQAFPQVVR